MQLTNINTYFKDLEQSEFVLLIPYKNDFSETKQLLIELDKQFIGVTVVYTYAGILMIVKSENFICFGQIKSYIPEKIEFVPFLLFSVPLMYELIDMGHSDIFTNDYEMINFINKKSPSIKTRKLSTLEKYHLVFGIMLESRSDEFLKDYYTYAMIELVNHEVLSVSHLRPSIVDTDSEQYKATISYLQHKFNFVSVNKVINRFEPELQVLINRFCLDLLLEVRGQKRIFVVRVLLSKIYNFSTCSEFSIQNDYEQLLVGSIVALTDELLSMCDINGQ